MLKGISKITLVLSAILYWSVLCNAQSKNISNRISAIPSVYVAKMDSLIISRTGNFYFNTYLLYDSSESGLFRRDSTLEESNKREGKPYIRNSYYYLFSYWFRFPDKPWHRTMNSFITDTIPSINKQMVFFYPDCLSDPSACSFLIDSAMAISIAQNAGFSHCLNSLSARLFPNLSSYVWLILCDLKKDDKSNERVLLKIDINSGKIIDNDTTRYRW